MTHDRRQAERVSVSGLVLVQSGTGAPARECRLTDISDGGVRLYIDTLDVPDEFTLWAPKGGVPRRRCQVIWRLGPELGAKFVDAPPVHSGSNLVSGSSAR